jgi:hypothetical protein
MRITKNKRRLREKMMKARAAVLHEIGLPRPYIDSKPLHIEEIELAPPGRDELLVRIKAAGLCHSDLSVINGDRPRPMPMALGHEASVWQDPRYQQILTRANLWSMRKSL